MTCHEMKTKKKNIPMTLMCLGPVVIVLSLSHGGVSGGMDVAVTVVSSSSCLSSCGGVCYNFLTLFPFLSLFLSPPVEPSFLYLSSSHQNLLIHMPLFHFLHCLMHSLQNLLFNEHSLKAIPSFSIKHFQVGYLSPSLDLNVL